ncbi:hypothetical protein VB776_17800 [Arcicella sp. DC2W]|uniref:Uncharacterized protein n=1 Tax=Arcicella gelida TaxID=2984195 RepID=A0ABU5S9A0_9BACT|nr:hypothetical protein [Arcicella sp. DC2W]MEA5404793.1 hypothetical protein [Arcicella sp. DC2W]
MSTTTETGHAINVRNFLDLINVCKAFGTQYQPSKTSIQIPTLEETLAQAEKALDDVIKYNIAYNAAINARFDLFKNNKTLATRLVNAFDNSDALAETKKDVKGFNRKLQGKKASEGKKKGIEEDAQNPKTKTVSSIQLSYTNQVEHLRALLSILANEPSYAPNEVTLQVNTIQELLTNQMTANEKVSSSFVALSNARLKRDSILYEAEIGLHARSLLVKKYVKSIFGSTSPEYKLLSKITFNVIRK